jgi:hypothetical protein
MRCGHRLASEEADLRFVRLRAALPRVINSSELVEPAWQRATLAKSETNEHICEGL